MANGWKSGYAQDDDMPIKALSWLWVTRSSSFLTSSAFHDVALRGMLLQPCLHM